MAQTQAPPRDRVAPPEPGKEASKPLATAPEKHHKRRISPFWHHYLQMALVMGIGMFASGAILTFALGLRSWDKVTVQQHVDQPGPSAP